MRDLGNIGEAEAFTEVRQIDLRKFAHPSALKSAGQLVTTLVVFAALWLLMAYASSRSWALTCLLAIPAGGVLLRLSLFAHDCGHGSFFRSRLANDVVGSFLGALVLTPYFYWRRTHALHHVNSSRLEGRDELGSISTLTVDEYEALSPRQQLGYRVFRHPLFLCAFGGPFQFILKHRFPWDTPRGWRREWASVFGTNVAIGIAAWILARHFGWLTVALVHLPIVVVASWGAVWLIYIQHVFPDGFYASRDEWRFHDASLKGSSYYSLPPVLRWITANVGLHHVHHYCPAIPNYRLEECMAAIAEFQKAKPLSLRDSFGCWSLKLWNPRRRAFEGFPAS